MKIEQAMQVSLLAALLAGTRLVGQTVVSNTTYTSGQTTTVSDATSIYASPAVDVQSGASISYFAGTKITLDPGFHAEAGAYFHAYLPLSGPINLHTSSVSSTSSVISWQPASGNQISRYDVYRNGTLIGSVTSSAALNFTDTTLFDDSSYSYLVQAVDLNGNKAGATLTVHTPPSLEVFTPTP